MIYSGLKLSTQKGFQEFVIGFIFQEIKMRYIYQYYLELTLVFEVIELSLLNIF